MAPTGAGDAARADLATLGNEPPQGSYILVVDLVDLLAAVLAWLAPPARESGSPVSTAGGFRSTAALLCHSV
jgi:hypothetical protein